jgi:hypothetical protein
VRNANRFVPVKTLDKCAVFLFFRERVWEKRRRRFALPAQSKKVLWSAVGSGAPHRFSLAASLGACRAVAGEGGCLAVRAYRFSSV